MRKSFGFVVLGMCILAPCSCLGKKHIAEDSAPIGPSKTTSRFLMVDTITTESDGWTLSEVTLGVFLHPKKKFYPNLKAEGPFTFQADWLRISYNDHRLILSASDTLPASSVVTDDDSIFMIQLTKGSEVREITGDQLAAPPPPSCTPNPSKRALTFGSDGGRDTISCTRRSAVIKVVFKEPWDYVDGVLEKGTAFYGWITISKLDGELWEVSAAPNYSDEPRKCYILFERGNTFGTVYVTQSGR